MSVSLGDLKIEYLYVVKSGGVIKSIPKAYIGSKKVFQVTNLILGPSVSSLSLARGYIATGSIGKYAVFAGGQAANGTTRYNNVDVYDDTLVKSTGTALSNVRAYARTARVGNYLLIGPGMTSNNLANTTVDAYDENLTRTIPTAFSQASAIYGATELNNTYAVFAGGMNGYMSNPLSTVTAYNSSLTRSVPSSSLSVARQNVAAVSPGAYALFASGNANNVASNAVDIFNTSFTRTVSTFAAVSCPSGGSNKKLGVVYNFNNRSISTGGRIWDENLATTEIGRLAYNDTQWAKLPCLDDFIIGFYNDQLDTTKTDMVYFTPGKKIKTGGYSFTNNSLDKPAATAGKYVVAGGGYTSNPQSVSANMVSVMFE